jgi:hypothetical protein
VPGSSPWTRRWTTRSRAFDGVSVICTGGIPFRGAGQTKSRTRPSSFERVQRSALDDVISPAATP